MYAHTHRYKKKSTQSEQHNSIFEDRGGGGRGESTVRVISVYGEFGSNI